MQMIIAVPRLNTPMKPSRLTPFLNGMLALTIDLRHHGEATGISPPSRADLAQWLERRTRGWRLTWANFNAFLTRHRLPAAPDGTNLTHEEPDAGILLVWSVGGEGGNLTRFVLLRLVSRELEHLVPPLGLVSEVSAKFGGRALAEVYGYYQCVG